MNGRKNDKEPTLATWTDYSAGVTKEEYADMRRSEAGVETDEGDKAASREVAKSEPEAGKVEVMPREIDWPSMANANKPHGSSIENVLYFCEVTSIQAKFNEFDGRTYVCIGDKDQELDDWALVEVMRQMHKCGCIVTKSAVHDALLAIGNKHRFHPVREYLNGLKWDGRKRLHKLLPNYLAAEDTPLNRAIGKAWMVAAVRRVRQPGCKFDAVLTLRGPQGSGKSTFFQVLGTPDDRDFFSDSMDIGASAKDTIENMSGVWIAEFPELSKLSTREVEQVKRATSARSDRARTAYSRLATAVKRQFVCGATVNQEYFLRDATGNRRFLIAEVGKTRVAELIADRDMLWAEAAELEANGEPHNIPEELWPAAAKVAEQHMKEDPTAEMVALKLGELQNHNAIVLSQDMALAIGLEDVSRRGGQTAQSMAAGAKLAGWSVERGRVAGFTSPGGVRHYASPLQSKKPVLYRYSETMCKLAPWAKGRFVTATKVKQPTWHRSKTQAETQADRF